MKNPMTSLRNGVSTVFLTTLVLAILVLFLSPFAFMVFTSLKTTGQISQLNAPLWPAKPGVMQYNDKSVELYKVPQNTCAALNTSNTDTVDLGLVKKGRQESTFVHPGNLELGEFTCQVSWRNLERPWQFSPTWSNYKEVWDTIEYPRLLWNTFMYAVLSNVGVLISCTLVAYGFSRFRFPGRDFLFLLLISTIFLPGFVTVIPTFAFFKAIGWVGTWLPVIVPTFFANAYDTFLLRQFFMTLPRELDEAAMIDGAGPFRVLFSILLPQAYPALMAITVFHIVYAWNDYFGPLIYLSTNREAWPISIALTTFNGIYGSRNELIQAGALISIILPMVLFFSAQRFFIQGIVVTGVEK